MPFAATAVRPSLSSSGLRACDDELTRSSDAEGLYSYTSSRFDRFKVDLERKNALDQHNPAQA